MKGMLKWYITVVVTLLALLGALGTAEVRALDKVKVGYLAAISFAPIFIAMDLKYYAEEGLETELLRFASGTKMMAPIAAGEIDAAAGGSSAGLFNSIAQGMDVYIVADKGQVRPGYGWANFLLVRKDLVPLVKEKGIKALEGMNDCLWGKGGISDYSVYYHLKHLGSSLEKFQSVFMAPPKQFQAWQSKACAIGNAAEPWGIRAEDAGLAVRYQFQDEVPEMATTQVAVIMYSGKFVRERRDTAQKWMNAYIKAMRHFNDKGMNDTKILEILQKYTEVPADLIRKSKPLYLPADGSIYLPSLEHQLAWYKLMGFTKADASLARALDDSFRKAAVAKLSGK